MSDQINIHVSDKAQEIRLLQGEAPKHYDPVPLNITGNIFAPRDFFLRRKDLESPEGNFSPGTTYVHVNKDAGIIKFIQHDRDNFANVITGELKISSEFANFQINTDKKFSVKDLVNHLRRRRHLFYDQQEGLRLIAELQAFNAKMNTNIADQDDKKGRTKSMVDQSIETNVPLTFTLNIPLFSGIDSTAIQVEIIISVEGGVVSFMLDSIDAIQQMDEMKEDLILLAVEPMDKAKIPIIYK